jgi:hypothetical protein
LLAVYDYESIESTQCSDLTQNKWFKLPYFISCTTHTQFYVNICNIVKLCSRQFLFVLQWWIFYIFIGYSIKVLTSHAKMCVKKEYFALEHL